MAYIKIFGIKSTVKKAVDYITNPDKTDEQNLVSSYGCSPETADLEFAMTAKLGKDNVMEKGDNLAWHMIISFKPGEITDPHIAHEIATKIADATLKSKQHRAEYQLHETTLKELAEFGMLHLVPECFPISQTLRHILSKMSLIHC